MSQVSAMCQVESEDGVAWLEAREHDSRIGGGARVRLHVGPRSTKKPAQTVNGKLLHLVHELTTAVVALAGKAFSVFVGQDASLCSHHGFTGVIFRGNELSTFDLTNAFAVNKGCNFGVNLKGI